MSKAIDLLTSLKGYIAKTTSSFDLTLSGGVYFCLANSGRRGGTKWFNLGLNEILATFRDIELNLGTFSRGKSYDETKWRDYGEKYFTNEIAKSLIQVQTKPFFTMLGKILHWANEQGIETYNDDRLWLTEDSIKAALAKLEEMEHAFSPENMAASFTKEFAPTTRLRAVTAISLFIDSAFEVAVSGTGFNFGEIEP